MQLARIDNPPNPYSSTHAEWLEPPPHARLEIYEDHASSILSRNDSPDLPFTWSVNPYRGCLHACAYCYARPYHELLGFGAGTDFESRLTVKKQAPTLLQEAFANPRWTFETVNFSGVTDCYQPIEASYEITRACLSVCKTAGNPVGVITKAFLIVRDIDLLAAMADRSQAAVYISIPFADNDSSHRLEPFAPPPERRFEAIRRLHDAGIPVGIMIAPVIPGLNDSQVPELLQRAAEAGARAATFAALRLPGSVEQVFTRRLESAWPLRARKIMNRLRDIRGGHVTDARFGYRMSGQGPYWDSVCALFEINRCRFGLERRLPKNLEGKQYARTRGNQQQMEFDFHNA